MTEQKRRMGRPPRVREADDHLQVVVSGIVYRFRQGSDGHVRALGLPERGEDFHYAKRLVADHIAVTSHSKQAGEGQEAL